MPLAPKGEEKLCVRMDHRDPGRMRGQTRSGFREKKGLPPFRPVLTDNKGRREEGNATFHLATLTSAICGEKKDTFIGEEIQRKEGIALCAAP